MPCRNDMNQTLVFKGIHSWGSYVVFSKSLTPIEFQTWLVMKTCSITKRIVDFEAQHCALSFCPVILKLLTDSSSKRHVEAHKFLKLYLNPCSIVPSAIDSESINPLFVLHSGLNREW